jgi:hypothetical protein
MTKKMRERRIEDEEKEKRIIGKLIFPFIPYPPL